MGHTEVSPGLTKLRLVKASQTASCVSQLLKIHFTLFYYTCRYKWSQLEWATFHTLHSEISQPPKSLWGSFHQRHTCSLAEQHLSSDREIPALQNIQCCCRIHQRCSLCSQSRNTQRGKFLQQRKWVDCAGNEIQISRFYCSPSQVIKPHAGV